MAPIHIWDKAERAHRRIWLPVTAAGGWVPSDHLARGMGEGCVSMSEDVSPLRHLTRYVTSIPATGARTGIHTHNDVIALLETYIYETNYDN